MKRTKLCVLVALLLICAMLLASCGGDEKGISKASSFNAILNPDYNPNADKMTTASTLDGLDGYTVAEFNDDFAVFTKESFDTKEQTIKIVSLRQGTIVLSVTSSEDAQYSVTLNNTPTFTVHKRYGENLGKDRYTLYDAAGNSIASQLYKLPTPSTFADLILFDSTLYEEDETGKLNEVVTIAENFKISEPDAYSEKYFYFFNKYGVNIYDREFKFKASYETPAGADYVFGDDYTICVLNNGNVLIQYAMQLDPETKEYDFFTESGNEFTKFDLCTYILNPETGKTKEVKADFVIDELVSKYELSEEDDPNNSYFAKDFENLALVNQITDKRINTRSAGSELVLMNNSGKITSSLTLVDSQNSSIPQKIADNTYVVSTEYGRAIVNAKGDTLLTIYNSSLDIVGSHIVGEKAVYNLQMEIIYNLNENEAKILDTLNGSIFIAEEVNDTTYEVICLKDGTVSSLCTIDSSNADSNQFRIDEQGGYYCVYRSTTEQYSYFNATGDLLITSDYALSTAVTSYIHGTAILKTTNNEYFLLTK